MEALTSKTSMIKSMLLSAWRERWDEVVWGINIKKVLPRGVSGDVYDLADCILQQALVAPSPNQLFIKYLNHCISGQLVSYGAVLTAISRYNEWNKPNCIVSLLDLLGNYKDRISCQGNEEECIDLCKSLVAIVNWLYNVVLQALMKLAESKANQQSPAPIHQYDFGHFQLIIEKSSDFISYLGSSSFLKSLFYVGQAEDRETFAQFVQRHAELTEKMSSSIYNLFFNREVVDVMINFLQKIEWINSHPAQVAARQLKQNSEIKFIHPTSFGSLNAAIAFDAVLNPASDIQVCVNQILMIAKFNDLAPSDLYCEIIRACLVGLVDACGSLEDAKNNTFINSWAAFIFLKVPQILSRLHHVNLKTDDIDLGLEKLLIYSPLLDLTDFKSNCDCLQYLLNKLVDVELLTNARAEKILSKRKNDKSNTRNLPRTDQQQSAQTGAYLILKAEPTVTSILKTLDSDYSKNQEGLLSVLAHMNCKNLELILCAAAATGKLLSFTSKLIKFNEFNKQASGEGGKASQTRALLFDITFLMLCYVAQHYGTDIITTNDETKDSFFSTWCTQNLVEGGRYRNPDLLLANCDGNKVDLLLNQFTSSDGDFKTSLVKWHDVCINSPLAIKEVLLAWEHGEISTDNVKLILDNVKRNMCSLPVVISAWLCAYINILHHEERLKPINLLQQFMTPLTPESPEQPQELFYKERSTLMINIIKKMFYDLLPMPSKIKTVSSISTLKTPLWEIMESNFQGAQERSWLDIKTVYNMDTLLCVGGPLWFADTLVRQILKCESAGDLSRAVDLVFGLFHMDIEQCALALLTKVIPGYLLNESKQDYLCEPKASALVRLTVMSVYDALYEYENSTSEKSKRLGRKRHYYQEMSDLIIPDDDKMTNGPIRPTKLLKSESHHSDLLDNTPFSFEQQQLSNEQANLKADLINKPIYKAISNLLRLLTSIAADSNISHRTLIPILFLEQLILCVKEDSHKILQFMPVHLIYSLIKKMPESISFEFLLAICNVQTVRSRKITARSLCQLAKAKKSD